MKDLLSIADLSSGDLSLLLELAGEIKREPPQFQRKLGGELVVVYMTEPSHRTRILYATAAGRLGATLAVLGPAEFRQGWDAGVDTIARMVSRYAGLIVARTDDRSLQRLAERASVPVLNGLGADQDPAQAIADLLTVREHVASMAGARIAYVGPATEATPSLVDCWVGAGMEVRLATPPGPEADAVVAAARTAAARSRGEVRISDGVAQAVDQADAIYLGPGSPADPDDGAPSGTSVALSPEAVDVLLGPAAPGAVLLHGPSPDHGLGAAGAVVGHPRSRVRDQADNRLPAAMALLFALYGRDLVGEPEPVPRIDLASITTTTGVEVADLPDPDQPTVVAG